MNDKLTWPVDPYQGLRGVDDFGSGAFHASRVAGSHNAGSAAGGEAYLHQGLDLAAKPGSLIRSPCDGLLYSPGFAYRDGAGDLRSLHLVGIHPPFERFKFKLLYAKLIPDLMGIYMPKVKRGDPIALAQDVAGFHMANHAAKIMINHIHFEVRAYMWPAQNGRSGGIELVDPLPLLEEISEAPLV